MDDFLKIFREHNVRRCYTCFKHSDNLEWWTNAIAGEAGEACNLTKKMSREGLAKLSTVEFKQARRELIIELADVITYCDLLLARLGADTETELKKKFDIVSQRCGYEFKFYP